MTSDYDFQRVAELAVVLAKELMASRNTDIEQALAIGLVLARVGGSEKNIDEVADFAKRNLDLFKGDTLNAGNPHAVSTRSRFSH